MGAGLDYRIYRTNDLEEVFSKWGDDIQESQINDGIQYSGCIGMLRGKIHVATMDPVNSIDHAEERLSNDHKKWGRPMAIPFFYSCGRPKGTEKQIEAAKKKYDKSVDNLTNLTDKAHEEFFGAKSQFVGCKTCESKLSRTHLSNKNMVKCPLCGEVLLSNTWQDRLANAKKKKERTSRALRQLKAPAPGERSVGWIVGGWCAS